MKTLLNNIFQDKLTGAGLVLSIISGGVFAVSLYAGRQAATGIFFINYILSVGYLLAVLIETFSHHKWKLSHGKLQHTAFLLTLWLISAYALNRDMNVFENSVSWLCVWIVTSAVIFVLAVYYQILPNWIRPIIFFLLGAAFLLFIYYSFYLFPLYIISVIGLIAIGISMHSYIPLFMAIFTFTILIKAGRNNKKLYYAFVAGIILPLIVLSVYLFKWNSNSKKIDLLLNQTTLNQGKLPDWIAVSQGIEHAGLAEDMMKAGLVYQAADLSGNILFGDMPSRNFDEPRRHDPLIVMATLLFGKPNLDERDRINILKSMYDARHHAQERLWDGDHLKTATVVSNVKLYPEYRMAYTEKTLTVHNTMNSSWSRQEAIYTFHLPEGSVVSSLSLWINGQEEKSRLTTKAKADSAYKTIVGVEQHDPSVVHWQEGNLVSVRIFPCTPDENRKFRIGVTSPLHIQGDQLIYENIYFEGPEATQALETVQVTFSGDKPSALQLPAEMKQVSIGVYQANHSYVPYWEISCKAPQLATAGFLFGDTTYQVKDYKPNVTTFNPQRVYLDINSAWTQSEFNQVVHQLKDKSVYAYAGKLVKLTDTNSDEVFELTHKQNFSLFPVFEINHPDSSLVITKSNGISPGLQDLEGSEFAKTLTIYLTQPKQIRIFNLSSQTTPYIKALKELRVFNYQEGSITDLSKMLQKHQFAGVQENDSTVVIEHAGLVIQTAANVPVKSAPDHLLRLFAYNDIMKKAGANYFNKAYIRPDLIAEAEKGYIVSPVSSMIVLETQKDYERFGIDENKNSLKNASLNSSGAVPEPKEWLLIILTLAVITYTIFKPTVKYDKL
ncbi:XrtN system VIT domain-containing protein [Mucilaginibacter lacusdianchii]|uniref:XrtN system VIT domain-containing protein n=1 Tax=Mucilaginibacter lacusdianchii TaxID=2684211 RepID=UPI00131A8508|nr:XrtN system VIT domain-containing protein [Mucilaginibacter sp. JXJ CY 39]